MGAAKHTDQAFPRERADRLQRELEQANRRIAELGEEGIALRNQIRYMANTLHQAYHQDADCGWQECERPVCSSAAAAVKS